MKGAKVELVEIEVAGGLELHLEQIILIGPGDNRNWGVMKDFKAVDAKVSTALNLTHK